MTRRASRLTGAANVLPWVSLGSPGLAQRDRYRVRRPPAPRERKWTSRNKIAAFLWVGPRKRRSSESHTAATAESVPDSRDSPRQVCVVCSRPTLPQRGRRFCQRRSRERAAGGRRGRHTSDAGSATVVQKERAGRRPARSVRGQCRCETGPGIRPAAAAAAGGPLAPSPSARHRARRVRECRASCAPLHPRSLLCRADDR